MHTAAILNTICVYTVHAIRLWWCSLLSTKILFMSKKAHIKLEREIKMLDQNPEDEYLQWQKEKLLPLSRPAPVRIEKSKRMQQQSEKKIYTYIEKTRNSYKKVKLVAQLTLRIMDFQYWKIDRLNYVERRQSLRPNQNNVLSNYILVAKPLRQVNLPMPSPNSTVCSQEPWLAVNK